MASPVDFDHHASTPVDPRVLDAMWPWFRARAANADNLGSLRGRAARDAVEAARAEVAALVGADAPEVVFTSGATESIATVVRCFARRGTVLTQPTEHRATFAALEAESATPALLPVDGLGRLELAELPAALSAGPSLVSLMLCNNEVGTAHPIARVAEACAAASVPLHVDAAQGVSYLPLDAHAPGVTFVSLSAHKLYGPQGVGALVIRKSARRTLAPLIPGSQEDGRRGGTRNVPGIVGFGEAARLARLEGAREAARLRALRDTMATALLGSGRFVRNGDPVDNHPGNLSVVAQDVSASRLLVELAEEFCLGTGAACAGTGGESHVLRALGLDAEARRGTLRLGLGRDTTDDDAARCVARLLEVAARLAGDSC